ncbi:MAG: hypothetical protein RIB93_23795 [Coleofasciculus sp. D1-CHI-01]|uniref:hypothetical protein n=1 Tax=Coleofasciculus sp. D1-CHI-01 TaxID=3068482 RepID=UPI0032FD85CE
MESPITFRQNPPCPNFDIFLVRSRLRIRWVWLSSLGLIDCRSVGEWAGFVVPLLVRRAGFVVPLSVDI